MINEIVRTKQDSKLALKKAKKLFDITNTILDKNSGGPKFQFYLPKNSDLTRITIHAIDSKNPVILEIQNDFLMHEANICLLKRSQVALQRGKKVLLIVPSNFLKYVIESKINIDAVQHKIVFTLDEIEKEVVKLNSRYDEIFIFSQCSLKTLLLLKSISTEISCIKTFDTAIDLQKYLPINECFMLDDIIYPPFEIFDFARQFLPKNSRYNDLDFLKRLKRINSGADKPCALKLKTFNQEIDVIKDILEEYPYDNIVISLPNTDDSYTTQLSVEKYYKVLNKHFACSKYYNNIRIKNLHNIVITDCENAFHLNGYIDILILPQFNKIKNLLSKNTIFTLLCRPKDQLYIFSDNFSEYGKFANKATCCE